MTTPDLDRLEALAAAATPGPWIAEYSGEQGNCVIPHDAQSTREAVCVTRLYRQYADAEFIAATDPDTIRALCALARRAEAAEAERDELRAAVERVRALTHRPGPIIFGGVRAECTLHASEIRAALDGQP